MRAARLLPLAALAAAMLAPAQAQAGLGWHDAGAGAPASVTFNDVTRWGDAVVAVGRDGTGADAVPAIYRLAGDVWSRDTLKSTLPVKGELVDVAANAGGVWAVGARDTGAPLIVKLAAPAPADPVEGPREWDVSAPPVGMAALRSVAVSATAGYAGDVRGELWPIHGAEADPASTPRDVAVNGIALTAGAAYAVTDGGLAEDRIFSIAGRTAKSELAVPDTTGRPVVAVASGDAGLLAADDRGYWRPDARGVWQRSTTGLTASGFALSDLTLSDASVGTGVTALAGRVTKASHAGGYVWRGAVGAWSVEKVSDGAINGVAAYGAQDVWAAGDGGVLKRYFHKPDPDPVCTDCNGGGGGDDEQREDGGGSDGSGGDDKSGSQGSGSSNTNTTTVIPPRRRGDPTIHVVEPKKPASKKRPRKRPRRMVYGVKVLRRPRALVVTFRLRANARVALSAKRGRAVVSRARSRAMRAGRRRVVLPFRGKPPTQLRIVVRPLRAKKA